MPSWSQMLIGKAAACHLLMFFFLLEFRHPAFDCNVHTSAHSNMHFVYTQKFCYFLLLSCFSGSVKRQQPLMIWFHACCCLACYSRSSAEVSLDAVVSQGDIEEPSQASDKAVVPSTSQEPSSSSAGKRHIYPVMEFYYFIFFYWECVLSENQLKMSFLHWNSIR